MTALSRRAALVSGAASALVITAAAPQAGPSQQFGANDRRLIHLERRWRRLYSFHNSAAEMTAEFSDRLTEIEVKLERRIASTPADTVHGAAAKARVHAQIAECEHHSHDDYEQRNAVSLCRDLARLVPAPKP